MKKLISLLFIISCDKNPDMKVYVSNPHMGGLYRAQANELIPYSNTSGYFCMNPEDFKELIALCTNPRE